MKKILLFVGVIIMFNCKGQEKEVAKKQQEEPQIASEIVNDIKLSSGILERVTDFPTQFIEPRNVDVWLPEGYSKGKKYAVLYMHDGQMLFDATTTWNKQEWKVDEVASQLMKDGKTKDFIVVAIWNISEIRWQDYYPQKTWNYVPAEDQDMLLKEQNQTRADTIKFNADNYLRFVTQEVKPYIDGKYSVHTDRENTFVSGSSMGGLISMYATFEYPEVFGAAACISTHWCGAAPRENNPLAKAFFEYMNAKELSPSTHRIYFDYGTKTLDQHYPQYADEVDAVFAAKGFDDTNYKNLRFEGAAHDEISWAKRLDIPLIFLLGTEN